MSTSDSPSDPGTPRPKKDQSRRIAALILGALAALFAVLNFDDVDVNWVFGTWSTPLIIVILVSFLLGVGFGRLVLPKVAARRASAKESEPA